MKKIKKFFSEIPLTQITHHVASSQLNGNTILRTDSKKITKLN